MQLNRDDRKAIDTVLTSLLDVLETNVEGFNYAIERLMLELSYAQSEEDVATARRRLLGPEADEAPVHSSELARKAPVKHESETEPVEPEPDERGVVAVPPLLLLPPPRSPAGVPCLSCHHHPCDCVTIK